MSTILFLILILLSFAVFFIPRSLKYYFTLFLIACIVVLTTFWSLNVFSGRDGQMIVEAPTGFSGGGFLLIIDRLSAFFIIVINITVFTGFLYARGYLAPYQEGSNNLRFSIHYFSYLWLFISMLLVVMVRNGLFFLIAWEIMALSSFFLVIFEAEKRMIMKTGISYLIQMHLGMFFILIAFILVERATGRMNFDSLGIYFSSNPNILLFMLFFIGFAIKAGFIPLHTWLPEAHPAAPSHVSGVMSGVMIKMGIYGIIRVIIYLQHDLLQIGVIIVVISLISSLLGVMMAIVQHDLKRLLAYHSIENIGIIGLGIGTGVIGIATNNKLLTVFGFSGGLLHVLNHSLFKSLLFFSAGSVYRATHTRNIEEMGGLMKKMPYTSLLFLLGSLAICGLPPFNGFISEYIIYMGMFDSLSASNLYQSIMLIIVIAGLSLTGGLAIFCFTKAFGIAFLGEARSEKASNASEVIKSMILPQIIPAIFILLIGLASVWFVKPVTGIVTETFGIPGMMIAPEQVPDSLVKISIISGIFMLFVITLLIYRYYHLKSRTVSAGPTWGCGYTAPSPKQQYTSTSFAYNYNHLAKPLLQTKKIMKDIEQNEIFPAGRTFESQSDDVFRKYIIDKPVGWISELLKKIAMMQTGLIQHYILYAFIFMLVVFLLTYLKII
ncbi:MAG TPA: proton-conducting transporter membrane subunit [Bacteroidales bacterium]|nr:proton-conducting transporter membrane subunit [Bacteroidales bacterium]